MWWMFRERIDSCQIEWATLDWCTYEHSFIVKEKHFEKQKLALNLFCDE